MDTALEQIHENLRKISKGIQKPARSVAVVKVEVSQTPKKKLAKRRPYQFEMFKIWLSFPPQWHGQSAETLGKIGIQDPDAQKLLACRNFTQFAATYKVTQCTLSEWHKELKDDPDVLKGYTHEFRKLTKAGVMALYMQLLKNGDADRLKAWMTFVEGWKPTQAIEQTTVHFDVVSFIEKIEERNWRLREGLPDNDSEHEQNHKS